MNPIRYSAIISTAWNKLWKGGWVLRRFALVYAVAVALLYGSPFALLFAALARMDGQPNVPLLAASAVALGLGMLALLILSVFYQGGVAWLTNEVEEDRSPGAGDGFAAGARAFWRLLGLDATIWLAGLALVGVLVVAVALLVGGASLMSGGDSGAIGAAFVGGFCCFYTLFLVFAIATAVVVSPLIAVAIRAISLEGAGVRDGFAAGWRAIRHRFKNSVVTSLMLLGLTYAFSFVISLVTQPLYYLGMAVVGFPTGPDSQPSPAAFGAFGFVFVAIFFVSMVSSIPAMVFLELGWTAFWRQLTGRDVPPERLNLQYPAGAFPQYGNTMPPASTDYPPMAPPAAPESPATPTSQVDEDDARDHR